ncbi:hypothetical protein ACFLZ6_01675 [Nanoarchaeota archaeon]
MTLESIRAGGSNQGCGNGAWAGYIDAILEGKPIRKQLAALGGGGMASNLWPGNLGGTAVQMREYRQYANVEKIQSD